MKIDILKNTTKIILGVSLIFTSGCTKFLSEKDPSNLAPENFFTIPDHADAAVAAIYADTRGPWGGAGIFSSNWQLLEAPTGTSTTETAQNSDLNNLYSLTWDGNTGHIVNYWNSLYKVIADANLAIDKIPTIPLMDETLRKRKIGEAQFLRAWAYFYAVRLWGDVPLVTKPVFKETDENFFPSRAPQEEVYKLIVSDLQAAETVGLPWTDASGRVSTAAAKAQLAKVYLTMAGQPLNKGAAYFKLAADKAKEVIDYANGNPAVINLFPTYYDVHNPAQNNKLEHIFEIQYNADVSANPMDNYYPNFKPVTYNGQSGTGSSVPTLAFYNSYEAGDLRAKDQEGYFYTSYYTNGNGAKFNLGAPYVFKHFNITANGGPLNGGALVAGSKKNDLNVPQIRYAEVLLIYAEAQNEVGGPTQEAYDALKKIRDRAKLTTPAMSSFTQASFREAVWKERWYELCYEGITWFDMIRLRKVYNFTTKQFDEFVGHRNANNFTYAAKHLLMPLGVQEMLNNPGLKTQNPGY